MMGKVTVALVAVLVAAETPGKVRREDFYDFRKSPPDGLSRQPQATFTSRTSLVSVDVSVRVGANPIPNLTAADFTLRDNGVVQSIDAVSIEAVPIDVTLFHDTSPSLAGKIDQLKDDLQRIAKLLKPGDRFRVLTFGLGIDATRWHEAGEPLDLSAVRVGRISPVDDALIVAMMRRPEPDRRHLIVALTDAQDAGSAVGSDAVRDVASRAEAVLHIVKMEPEGGNRFTSGQWLPIGGDAGGEAILGDAAARTGGRVHEASSTRDVVAAFRRAYDDFRQSYVLRYTPKDVPMAGWHEIAVEVPGAPRATVRARRGYFVTSPSRRGHAPFTPAS
jgi:VWFA-related protein